MIALLLALSLAACVASPEGPREALVRGPGGSLEATARRTSWDRASAPEALEPECRRDVARLVLEGAPGRGFDERLIGSRSGSEGSFKWCEARIFLPGA